MRALILSALLLSGFAHADCSQQYQDSISAQNAQTSLQMQVRVNQGQEGYSMDIQHIRPNRWRATIDRTQVIMLLPEGVWGNEAGSWFELPNEIGQPVREMLEQMLDATNTSAIDVACLDNIDEDQKSYAQLRLQLSEDTADSTLTMLIDPDTSLPHQLSKHDAQSNVEIRYTYPDDLALVAPK